MKTIIALSLLIGLFSQQLMAQSINDCQGIRMYAGEDSQKQPIWELVNAHLTVTKNVTNPYGLEAIVENKDENTSETITDVKGEAWMRADIINYFKALNDSDMTEAEVMDIFIPGSGQAAQRAEYYNIGVAANRDDAAGADLVILKDNAGVTLGKFIRFGWAVGVCIK